MTRRANLQPLAGASRPGTYAKQPARALPDRQSLGNGFDGGIRAVQGSNALPIMAAHPDDPDLPSALQCVEAVLEWRATIPPEDRFWRQD